MIYTPDYPTRTSAPDLTAALKDENALVRRDATKALAMFGAAAEVAVPALIDALADENRWVRQDVVVALGKIGRRPKLQSPP